jgi:hypothetical protein
MSDEQLSDNAAQVRLTAHINHLSHARGWQVIERDDSIPAAILYLESRVPESLSRGVVGTRSTPSHPRWRRVWVDDDGKVQQQNATEPLTLLDS